MMEIKDFEQWFKKINKKYDEDNALEFIWELMETPFTEYHYSLIINENTNNEFKNELWNRFNEHEDVETFLIKKLENNEDTEYHGNIIFNLGEIVDRKNGKQKEKVLECVYKLINSPNNNTRENAIIVLGWIGSKQDIELLGEKLLNDTYNKCRAWSASAFMQIWFRKKNKTFVERALLYLYKAIRKENDYFVIGSIIRSCHIFIDL
jgi:hypothetical protein